MFEANMSEYDFTEIARIVATRENIQDYKLEHQYSSNKGDGYMGSVRAISITGSNKQLNVVFKYSHRDPKAHENLPLHDAYASEIQFYEVIVPTYRQFQAEHNIQEPFNNSAAYYGSIETPLNECVAMENLKCQNYDLWDRKKEMNQAHLEMALKTFAKLHGTSMAMKHMDPKLYAQLITGFDKRDVLNNFIKKVNILKQISEIILTFDNFNPISEKVYQEKLDYFRVNIDDLMEPVFKFHDNYDVILQGDCWCTNAMYCYEDMNDRSKPKDIKLLDWQVVKLGTVVHDLSYFFYSIAPKESIDNLDHFLKVYHDTLTTHLKAFGLNVDDIYPYKVFLNHWQKNALYGFMLSFMIRKLALVESEDAPELENKSNSFLSDMRLDNDMDKLYKQRMKNLVMHFVERQFL